ncbi:MAG: hypothetical protein K2K96_10410, partial [Lachnospiraceae bacterium]|nr:hypothetical protein [Lachnospiraceae bacterium]
IFTRMVLPNLRKAAYIITVLSLVNSFKVYREVYLLVGAYPDENIYMLQHLFNNWFSKLDINKLSAASCVTAVFLFALLGILLWISKLEFKSKNKHDNLFFNRQFKALTRRIRVKRTSNAHSKNSRQEEGEEHEIEN